MEKILPAICTGSFRSMALKSNGTVWAWGWNLDREVGDGTFDGGGMYTKKWLLENLFPSNDGNKIRLMSKANPTQVIATNKKTFFNVNYHRRLALC